MTRPLAPLALLAAAALSFLAGCAQPGTTPSAAQTALAAPAQAPVLAPLPPAAPASAPGTASGAAPDPAPDAAAQRPDPILIRGDDRVVATPRTATSGAVRGPAGSYKFEDAPVGEVVKVMLGDLLQADYVVHPPLNGTVTLSTRGQVSADRAMFLLEQALQANGIVIARDARGTYHVGTAEALRGIVSAPQMATRGTTLPPGYGAVIISPQYLGAGELANILRPLVSSDAIVRVDAVRNILVMRGTRAEAEGWMDIVNTFDVNLLRGMSVGVFPLKHTTAADADAALRLLSGGVTGQGAGTGAPGQAGAATPQQPARARPPAAPAAGAAAAAANAGTSVLGESNPLFGALRIMPIERINAVLVITPRAAYLDEVRYWIEQFDRPDLNSAEPQLHVYKVQNGSADHLADLLNGIYGGTAVQTPTPGGGTGVAPGLATTTGSSANVNSSFASQYGTSRSAFGNMGGGLGSGLGGGLGNSGGGLGTGLGAAAGRVGAGGAQQGQQGPNLVTTTLGQSVRVMADRINNTLLVHATPAEYQRIESTLKRLDVQRAQVLIEASIVEVTLGDGLEYGLQWAFRGGLGGGDSGRGVIGTSGAGGTLAATGAGNSGFSYTFHNAVGISAVLTALANKSMLKVISSPSLMVLDNHTAAIQVGNQEPVNVGSTSVNPGTTGVTTYNSIQYKDTGVMLGVTPSVSAGDLVTLDVDQTVTNLGPDSGSAQTKGYPTFLQRQINSKVAVRSGETLVLGGLIRDSVSNTKSGVPILSAIPVVGALFGTHSNTANRTELLVILTPRVLRSDEDARAVSRELRQRMQGLVSSSPTP
ncbi:MAG: type II secretion system secretin GspD [Pseudomonadota bacterium]|nr:type II secretion system secretin GspD [Pseudomonadota bacterium]